MNQATTLDIGKNRATIKYSRGETLKRVLWWGGRLLFRFSPRPCFGWRRFVLRMFGAKVGREAHLYNTAIVYFPWNLEIGDWSAVGEDVLIYNLGLVKIGSKVTISHRAHLCAGTHDYEQPDMPLLKTPIVISDQAWVCADAFIGPGVVVGEGAVVGARAVACKNVDPWAVVVGNPARVVKERKLQPPR